MYLSEIPGLIALVALGLGALWLGYRVLKFVGAALFDAVEEMPGGGPFLAGSLIVGAVLLAVFLLVGFVRWSWHVWS